MSQNRQTTTLMVPIDLAALVVGLAEEHEPGGFIMPHRHDAAQLIYATDGVMTVETENGAWVVPPARAVWVPAFTTHSIRMTGLVRMRTLYVEPSAAPISDSQCCVVHVSELLRACIRRFFELPPAWAESGPEARMMAVLFDELRAAPTAPLHLPMPRDPRALRAAESFRQDPSVRHSVGRWAKIAGTSERTLERLWSSEVGLTFGRWQQQARLLRALEVLASGCSVTEAALEVGFETPSSFISMFRRAFGTTPARYFRDAGP